MPFAGRVVQPLGHEVLPGSLATDDPELMPTEVSNGILVTVLEQMKCLVRHADDIFCDITEECHKVVERTEKVNEKVKSLTVTVENLDYRNVPIPVGSLKVFCQKENGIDHFAARHGYDCLLFAPDTRPQSLKDRYNMAAINPVEIIRRCDEYRRDGVKGSMLFRQWPVFVKQPKSKTPDLSFRKLPPVITFEKDYKPLKLRNIVIKRCDSGEKDGEEEVKPDTEVIPINTSGVAFQRMCSFRQSLRSVDGETTLEKDLKKKRRQTFSGVPPSIWKEICAFESSKSEGNKRISIHDKLKSYSFDDLDSVPGANEEGELIKYLNQVEDRIEEREELEHSLSENKFLRLIPCRRSCSLPRSAKLTANRQRFHNSRPLSKCEAKSETTLATLRGSTGALANKRCSSIGSTLSLYSAGSVASSRQSRSTKRSSLSGVKRIKSLLNVGKPTKDIPSKDKRPKSLDLDALEVDSDPAPRANLNRTPSMPEGMHSSVGPGSFYYFDNNTLPKTLAKKYDFPWESLPKDWTTSVKLREISKRRVREDRNSSSGNWSGSSARQSMESERAKSISASHRSLGTDSGRESPTPTADGTTTDTAGEAGDEGSVIKGNGGRTSVDKRSRSSRLDTEAWLRNLSMRAAARVDSSSSSETLNSLKVDVPPMEDFTGDIMERYHLMDDDASSVYSLDQEGFYTSFHTDSGLRRSTTTLWEEEEATVTSMSPVDDTDKPSSVQSVSSNLSADSVIYKPLLKTVPSPVIMRPPPKRQASSGGESDGSAIFTLPAQTPQPSLNPTIDFSFSESDQEIIYARVKQKTKISTTMYPSLCDVSNSSDSEEDGSKEKTIGTDRLHNQKPLFDPDSVKVVELSPGIKSSLGAVEGQRVHNRLDGKDYSSSKVLSTFSSGSDDQLDTKVLPSPVTATVCVTSQPKHNTSAIDSRRFPSQNFSSVSSLERKSSSSAAYKKSTLKHSGSLDDSNLLESSGEDKPIKKQVFNSLPRHYHVYKRNSYGPEYTNSWPRSHQSAKDESTKSQPASGILKSTQKQSVLPKAPKTLNFSPVVNMFDPGTPETIQVFPTSSGESPVHQVNRSNLPQANSFKAPDEPRAVVKLENARPISSGSESDITHESELPAKYQSSLVVRPGKRTSSSGSDVSPYATSSVTQSLKRNSVSSNPGDLGIYRKSLVTSPTVDSGIGSVGDLSPSTPTSSIGTDEDVDRDYSVKKVTSPSEDSVFPHSVRHRTQDAKFAFLNNPPTLQAQMSVEKKLFGADIVGTGADIEYADDSDNTEDTPTHQPYQPHVPLRDTPTHQPYQPPLDTPTHQPYQPPVPRRDSSSSTAQTNGYGIVRSSLSDSKLMDSANNNKAALPSRYSCSSLPPSGMNRTEGDSSKVGSQTSQNVSPSIRTSSYRNACSNTSRSPSYRYAQNQLDVGSKVVNSTAVPAVRSESYRVACEDLVPPPVPEHRNRADPMKKATDPESAARAESYRVAIEEMEDPEIFEYKAVNKRAAITSLDQLLPKPAGNASKGLKSPKQIKRSITDSGFFARFRGKQDKSSSKLNTSATEPVKGSYVPLGLPNGSKVNSKPKAPTSSYRVKPKSSTYMSFDILSSVEEVKEDSMHGSLESVKAPSMSSLQSFQSGQSAQSFLRRDSSDTQQDDSRPLVRRGHQHTTSKSSGPVIRPSTDNRRRSTGSTSHSRIIAGPHSTSAYKSLLMDDSMETGV